MRMFLVVSGWLLLTGVPADAAQLRVAAATPDLGAIAREVGGSHVVVTSLIKGAQDPHFVDPRPSLLVTLGRADALIEGGLGLEAGWLPSLVEGARNTKIRPGSPGRINASVGIQVLGLPSGPIDRSMGDVHPGGNPHFLLDPLNGAAVAETIAEHFCALDVGRCGEYRDRAAAFRRTIGEALERWTTRLAPYRGAKLVTYHDSWVYFTERFGLEIVGFVESRPGVPPASSHVATLSDLIRREGVKVIVMEPYFSRSIPDLIARQTGAQVLVLAPSVGALPATDDYVSMCDVNVGRLAEALSIGEKNRP